MLHDRVPIPEPDRRREGELRRRHGERRFEALYMQSFVEMRARSSRD